MKILVLCPTHRDRRELPKLGGHEFHFAGETSVFADQFELLTTPSGSGIVLPDLQRELDRCIERYGKELFDGVISTDDYPGTFFAAVLREQLGLPGVSPRANILCQHKFLSRVVQQEAAPRHVPRFALAGTDGAAQDDFPYPLFIKPVKSFFSVCSTRLERRGAAAPSLPPVQFFDPFDAFTRSYFPGAPASAQFIAEEILYGKQCTLEGYRRNGKTTVVGIVDSIFFPGTLSFSRFEYPSELPAAAQTQMAGVAADVMAAIGYDNGFFNIEFLYDEVTQRASIVEINPRAASQFADLYEKVDGRNSYELLIQLACGKEPDLRQSRGKYACAASCVWRVFEDRFVRSVPPPSAVTAAETRHPDARVEILAEAGQQLSAQLQDGMSFRYGMVNLGGNSRSDIVSAFEECSQILRFGMEPVPGTAP